jgi:glycosyltransferase involved in cell wall biosynthesis
MSINEDQIGMRIGIDGSCLPNRRGFGRFARGLLDALARQETDHRFEIVIDRASAHSVAIPSRFARVVVDVSEAPSRAASASGRRRIADLIAMGRAVAQARFDVMFFPSTYSFFPVWSVGKLVVTMHDMLPLTHPELVFPTLAGRLAWQLKETVAAWRSDRIVTVSQASRRALQAYWGLPEQRFHVITEGPDPMFGPRPLDPAADALLRRLAIAPGERYLLYVGGLSPHKNLLRLIKAFAQAAADDVKLLLTGDFHDVFHTHVPQIRAAIAAQRLEKRVILTGYIPDDELVFLYSRAYALVQPSLVEGFGLPAVEAMACGAPVIASRAGSLPEVVGPAGVYFDPTDVGSMAGVIGDFLSDFGKRRELAAVAPARAAMFSWDASARALLECFDGLDSRAGNSGLRLRGKRDAHSPDRPDRNPRRIRSRRQDRRSAPN